MGKEGERDPPGESKTILKIYIYFKLLSGFYQLTFSKGSCQMFLSTKSFNNSFLMKINMGRGGGKGKREMKSDVTFGSFSTAGRSNEIFILWGLRIKCKHNETNASRGLIN